MAHNAQEEWGHRNSEHAGVGGERLSAKSSSKEGASPLLFQNFLNFLSLASPAQPLPPVLPQQSKVQGPTLNVLKLPPDLPPHLGLRLGLEALFLCQVPVLGLCGDDASNALLGPWPCALAPMVRATPRTGHCRALTRLSALGPCTTALALPVWAEAGRSANSVTFCELYFGPQAMSVIL